ncbi:hypothetical protein Taro_042948 [Colocasia esculenta]|uniref:Uncharacterized protein n=1 Tax=Colocasia esculenta TaxID=4460 RepID=A0A843WQ54_COLES|nr:hypothetical protein [Colocasia esculenta]
MDEERLLAKFVQHMSRREMARNLHNNESESGCQSKGQQAYKWVCLLCGPSVQIGKEAKTASDISGGKTHNNKGADQYISDRAREVALYSQQMTEKYAGEEEQPQLDLEVWVTALCAPRKGHVYGFRHSMDTSKVLSSASSSSSQVTSAFTTPGAPGTSPSEMMGFIQDEITSLESRLIHTMHTQVSNAVQAQLSQAVAPRELQ